MMKKIFVIGIICIFLTLSVSSISAKTVSTESNDADVKITLLGVNSKWRISAFIDPAMTSVSLQQIDEETEEEIGEPISLECAQTEPDSVLDYTGTVPVGFYRVDISNEKFSVVGEPFKIRIFEDYENEYEILLNKKAKSVNRPLFQIFENILDRFNWQFPLLKLLLE